MFRFCQAVIGGVPRRAGLRYSPARDQLRGGGPSENGWAIWPKRRFVRVDFVGLLVSGGPFGPVSRSTVLRFTPSTFAIWRFETLGCSFLMRDATRSASARIAAACSIRKAAARLMAYLQLPEPHPQYRVQRVRRHGGSVDRLGWFRLEALPVRLVRHCAIGAPLGKNKRRSQCAIGFYYRRTSNNGADRFAIGAPLNRFQWRRS